jgi:hypothetical protein
VQHDCFTERPVAALFVVEKISADLVIGIPDEIRGCGQRIIQSTDENECNHENDEPRHNDSQGMPGAGSGHSCGRKKVHQTLLRDSVRSAWI